MCSTAQIPFRYSASSAPYYPATLLPAVVVYALLANAKQPSSTTWQRCANAVTNTMECNCTVHAIQFGTSVPEQSNQPRCESTFKLANNCTDVSRLRSKFAVCSRWVVRLRHTACLPTSETNSKDSCPLSSNCFVPTRRSPAPSHCDLTNHHPRI